MDSELILRIEQIVIAGAAIVGLVFTVIRWVVPCVIRISGTFKKIDTIYGELKPNGGSSLRDSIDRQEKAIAAVVETQDLADARQWAIVSSGHLPTWESGDEGGCLRPNAALLELVGRSADQLAGNGWENMIHKDDMQRCWAEWDDAVHKRRTFESTYRVINHSTGKAYEVDAKATPIINRAGKVKGWIGVYNKVRPV